MNGTVPHTAQIYIEGNVANDLGYELFDISKKSIKQLAGMICLDLILKNTDRHSNNWIVSKDEKIYAIDTSIGNEDITIKEALRPAFRCLLINDYKYSNILANEILIYLNNFLKINKSKKVNESIEDVIQWKEDLSQLCNKGFMSK